MNNNLDKLDDILYNNMCPWHEENKPDEKFASLISEINPVPDDSQQYEINFFRPFSNKTEYYQKYIVSETNAYCNQIKDLIDNSEDLKLKKYWYNDTLNKKLQTRLKDIGKLIKERNYDIAFINPQKSAFDIDADHKTETYIIHLLKLGFIKIYLEIQALYKHLSSDMEYIEADFYTRFINEPAPEYNNLKRIKQISKEKAAPKLYKKLTFGYNQTSTDILKNICKSLILKIDFINEDLTTVQDFISVMTSNNLTTIDNQIHIGCETRQFRYVVDKLQQYFSSFTLSNIDKSNLFYSKNGNKITATNLSRNKIDNPKEKETIDRIFKEMQ
jgi:molecular chaperone GrpE (heat shock protein)